MRLFCFLSVALQPKSDLGRLTVEVSRSHIIRHTHTHTHTPGTTTLDEGSARRRGRYLHNKHKRETSIPSAGFEPTVPVI
jgi:hypothetical protein